MKRVEVGILDGGRGEAPRRAYFPLLDSMRGIACVSVFVLHAGFYVGIHSGNGVVQYLVQHVSNYPAPAVVLFFVMSGFVLYRPFVARRYEGRPPGSLTRYGVHRAARILPAYWVALLGSALLLHQGYLFSVGGLRYLAFAQSYDGHTFNGGLAAGWTLDVDVAFYAALPLVVLLVRRLPARTRGQFLRTELAALVVLYLAATAWQALAAQLLLHQRRWFFATELSFPASLDLIVCGMALAVLSVAYEQEPEGRLRRLVGRHPWAPWLLAAAAYVAVGHVPHDLVEHHAALAWVVTKQLRCLFGVAVVLPLIFGIAHGGRLRTALGSRVPTFLGTVSYAFYLWHGIVLRELDRAGFVSGLGTAAFLAVALTLSVLMASASTFVLEHPLQQAVRHWLGRHGRGREPMPLATQTPTGAIMLGGDS